MPRIRTIKPEFWSDEKLSLLDPLTRLVYLGLISMADDAGRLIDNVKLLDGMLFPNTDDTCREPLDTLARISRISRYRSSSGQELIQIINWGRHQKVDHPNKYTLPGPPKEPKPQLNGGGRVIGSVEESSRNPRETVAKSSRDVRDTTNDQRPTTNDLRSSSVADATAPKNWVADGAAFWREKIGDVTEARLGKALTGCVKTHGWPTVRQALEEYADAPANGRPKKLEWFAEDVVKWIAEAQEPLVGEGGVLTAKGRRFMGVAS